VNRIRYRENPVALQVEGLVRVLMFFVHVDAATLNGRPHYHVSLVDHRVCKESMHAQ
jgi:hypothetical protein